MHACYVSSCPEDPCYPEGSLACGAHVLARVRAYTCKCAVLLLHLLPLLFLSNCCCRRPRHRVTFQSCLCDKFVLDRNLQLSLIRFPQHHNFAPGNP